MWRPETKTTVVIGRIVVEDYQKMGLEDGLLGITLDPHFTENGWIYLYYSPPETRMDGNGQKAARPYSFALHLAGGHAGPEFRKK